MGDKPSAKEQFKAQDKSLPFKGPEAIDADCLECFAYEYAENPPGGDIAIVTRTNEFTSVCPFSGLPDFAEVTITYAPDKKCVELRSLKYYLMSYRDVGIWYEHLVKAIEPKSMEIEIAANARGGLSSTVTARYNRVSL